MSALGTLSSCAEIVGNSDNDQLLCFCIYCCTYLPFICISFYIYINKFYFQSDFLLCFIENLYFI